MFARAARRLPSLQHIRSHIACRDVMLQHSTFYAGPIVRTCMWSSNRPLGSYGHTGMQYAHTARVLGPWKVMSGKQAPS